jgi:GNAT superfamily N-acetyltransferase
MTECRAYHDDDLPRCVALLRRGHDAKFTESRFRWLHEQAPGGRSRMVVCESEGRLIGLSAVIPRPARLFGESILAGRDVDPVVDPDHRGRGLFAAMLGWLLNNLDGIDILYNFANRASAPGFQRCGWREAGRLRDHVAQLGYRGFCSREHLLYLATGCNLRSRPGEAVHEVVAAALDSLPPTTVTPPEPGFVVTRSLDHVKWRYAASPLCAYRYFVHTRNGTPLGLAVVSHVPEQRRLIVMDVLAFDPEGGRLRPYLPAWRSAFGDCWTCVWSGVPRAWRHGFIAKPLARGSGQPVLVRPAPGREELLPPGFSVTDMFLTHGDVEAN